MAKNVPKRKSKNGIGQGESHHHIQEEISIRPGEHETEGETVTSPPASPPTEIVKPKGRRKISCENDDKACLESATRRAMNPRRVSMSARKASIFVADAEGNQIMFNIHAPDVETEIAQAENVIVPPDGGYGYVIVLAAFLSNVIVDGIVFSFGGSLQSAIINCSNGDLSKADVAWIGSLLSGFYMLAGPFVSALANRYGFRPVAILGSLIASGSFVVAWLLNQNGPNLMLLIIFYGICGGIGFSCVYVPAVIAVGFYFEKKRALATGIAMCGSGIGGFIFPYLIAALIKAVGWQKTILVLGCIVLTCGLLGILYRPLKPKQKSVSTQKSAASKRQTVLTPFLLRLRIAQNILRLQSSEEDTDKENDEHEDDSTQKIHAEKPLITGDDAQSCQAPGTQANESSNNFYSGSSDLRTSDYDNNRKITTENVGALTKAFENTETGGNGGTTPNKKRRCDVIRKMFDFSLLLSPTFLVLAISGMFSFMGLFVPYLSLPAQAHEVLKKTDPDIKIDSLDTLISLIGAANTIGRIISGWIADRPFVNVLMLYNGAVAVMGLSCLMVPLLSNFFQYIIFCCVFGLSVACFASLRTILVVEFLGLAKLTSAFGLLLVFQGVAAMIGPPLTDNIAEITESKAVGFYLAGSFLVLSAVMCYPLRKINNWEKSRSSVK